jgi:hypothetical protein
VALSTVVVTDSDITVTPAYISGDLDSDSKLDFGEAWIFQATSTASTGPYANTGAVRGSYTDKQGVTHTASDSDGSTYYGAAPAIAIHKQTNGFDGDAAPGPYILVGETVTWTYRITNTGNVSLNEVFLVDDNGTQGLFADDFTSCSGLSLASNASTLCTTTGCANERLYQPCHRYRFHPGKSVSPDGSRYLVLPAIVIEITLSPADQAAVPPRRRYDQFLDCNTGNISLGLLIMDDRVPTKPR